MHTPPWPKFLSSSSFFHFLPTWSLSCFWPTWLLLAPMILLLVSFLPADFATASFASFSYCSTRLLGQHIYFSSLYQHLLLCDFSSPMALNITYVMHSGTKSISPTLNSPLKSPCGYLTDIWNIQPKKQNSWFSSQNLFFPLFSVKVPTTTQLLFLSPPTPSYPCQVLWALSPLTFSVPLGSS